MTVRFILLSFPCICNPTMPLLKIWLFLQKQISDFKTILPTLVSYPSDRFLGCSCEVPPSLFFLSSQLPYKCEMSLSEFTGCCCCHSNLCSLFRTPQAFARSKGEQDKASSESLLLPECSLLSPWQGVGCSVLLLWMLLPK